MKEVISTGIALLRKKDKVLQILLAHHYSNKEPTLFDRKWTVPKGKIEPGELLIDGAKREFFEETGLKITKNFYIFGQECKEPQPLVGTSYWTKEKGNKVKKHLYIFLAYDFLNATEDFEFKSVLKENGLPEIDQFYWADLEIAPTIVTYSQTPILTEILRLQFLFR
jgi:8-oxo-dGTP pyrophosphatase MutT (NUDIX family)